MRYLFSTVIPFLPILSQYKLIGNLSFGFLVSLIGVSYVLASNKKIHLNKVLLAIFVITLFIYLSKSLIYPEVFSFEKINVFVVNLSYLIAISIYRKVENVEILFKIYIYIALFATLLIVFQTLFISITGSAVAPINILPVATSDERLWQPSFRPSSIFTEPQTFATYVLPALLYSFYNGKMVVGFVLTIGVVLSTSTFGTLSLAVLILYYFISKNRIGVTKKLAFISILTTLISIGFYFGIFEATLEKLTNTDFSEQIRVTKGLLIIAEMNASNYFFGLNIPLFKFLMNNISEFRFLWPYINSEAEHLIVYVSTIYSLFIEFGIIALVGFVYFLISNYKNSSYLGKTILIVAFLLSVSSTFYLNAWFAFYFTIYFAYEYHTNPNFNGAFKNEMAINVK